MSPLLPEDFSSSNQLEKNPYIMANSVRDFTNTQRVLGNVFIEAQFIEGLTGKLNLGGDITSAKRKAYLPGTIEWVGKGNGSADVRNNNLHNILLEGTLNYTKTFGDLKLNALAGYTYQEFGRDYNSSNATGFDIDETAENNLNAANGAILVDSYKESSKLISWIGRANLSFKDKYVVTATVRADGSSRFGANNKWGVFPSFSAAWRLSEEDFLSSSSVVSNLKLRAGWGVTGSQEIGNYRSLPTLSGNKEYSAVGIGSGVTYNNYANPDLQWEETTQLNFGFDYELFSGIVYGTLDFYQKNTNNLLLDVITSYSIHYTKLYDGFFDQEVTIGNKSNFIIQLKVDAEQLEEVVVVGYGQMEKKDVTGAMASIKSENFNQGVMASPDQLIQGKIAGVQMTPSSGEPGAGVNIRNNFV